MDTLFFRRPRVVALALFVALAAGLSSLASIGRQEDPTITNLFATVTTVWPGADAARVEALVTTPIERALRAIPEIDTLQSASSANVSVVQIELVETIAKDRIEGIWGEIRDALADAATGLPAGVRAPEFSSSETGAYGALVALSALREGASPAIMGRHAVEIADALRNVPGTDRVAVFGAPEEEVLVTLDPVRAAALGITADEVSAAIGAADSKGQAGRLRGAGAELILNVAGEISALERVREVILREGPDGQVARLSDVARVERATRSPAVEEAIHDGRPAILVAARLESGLQVDVWMADIRRALDAAAADIPAGIGMELVFDQSRYTAERLAEVGINMAIGVALVVVVLLVTLGLRSALMVALILPAVSLATLATMNAIALPIHQMSVTGMIVALGLLVDAGIVMTDEVGRNLREGLSRLEAARRATRRLFAPLFASTVTTALSFAPMMLLPGPAGDFVGSIALAVVIMLFWSFLFAVTIAPAIAARLLPESGSGGGLRAPAVASAFRASLAWAMRHPARAVALALAPPLLGFLAMPHLTAQFFPGVDRDQFTIEIDMRAGAPLAQTRLAVERVDAILRATPETRSVSWVLGRSAPAVYYNIVGGRSNAPGHAQAIVTTVSPEATERLVRAFERDLGAAVPEAQVTVRGLVQGPPVAAPVELRVVGPDIDVLRETGAELRRIVAQAPGVTVVRETVVPGAPEVTIDVDEAAARRLGFDLAGVARQLEAGLEGVTGGSLVEATEELPVRVRMGDATRSDLAAIRDLPLIPPALQAGGGARAAFLAGALPATPLSAIASVELAPGASPITRRNGERATTVQAFVARDVLPEEALAMVRGKLDAEGFAVPRGYRLEIGGDSDARASTLGNLIASLGLIVTLSIAVVAATFQSFRLTGVAFVVAGLSAGSSLLALAIFDYPFGVVAIIGVIGSIGVSINAAIIILTGLQEDEAASAGDRDAMVEVVMRSSRHIVSTTVTTFGGFLPLILAGGGFWPPFAMAIAGGVLLSTIVSFYFVPPVFALVYPRRAPAQAQATPLRFEPAPRMAAE